MKSRNISLRATLAAALLAASLIACGSDSTGPSHANVSGQWTLNATNLTGSGISCDLLGTTLLLNQTGATFNGTYSGGSLSCDGLSANVGSGAVVNGTVNLQQVAFDLDTQDFHFTGAVSGNSMSGAATIRLVVEGITHTFTGNWSASRQ